MDEYTQDLCQLALQAADRIATALERIAAAVEPAQQAVPAETYREMAPPDRKRSAYHNPPPG